MIMQYEMPVKVTPHVIPIFNHFLPTISLDSFMFEAMVGCPVKKSGKSMKIEDTDFLRM